MAAAEELDNHLLPGDRVGDCWILGEAIGNGGHATVFCAEHEVLGESVAIKVLHLERMGACSDEMLRRFDREARIASHVKHPNVVRVFDLGELVDGSPFFVMERIEGEDLQARIDRDGPLPIAAAIDVALQVLAGLDALAQHSVVHRDVKPGNVMLRREPSGAYTAKLVDFGIAAVLDAPPDARVTVEGTVLGTPEYMAPEQIRGLTLDARADVYGLGVVLYECLTGRLPFAGKGPCATLAMALTQAAPGVRQHRPDCPELVEAIVMRALEKEREDRWESPRDMAEALDAVRRSLELPRGQAAWAGTVPSRRDAIGGAPLQLVRSKRPAARAGRAVPPPIPLVARYRTSHVGLARGRAANDTPASEPGPITLHLQARARAGFPAAMRLAVAAIALGVITALGLELTHPAQLGAIDRDDLEAIEAPLLAAQPHGELDELAPIER